MDLEQLGMEFRNMFCSPCTPDIRVVKEDSDVFSAFSREKALHPQDIIKSVDEARDYAKTSRFGKEMTEKGFVILALFLNWKGTKEILFRENWSEFCTKKKGKPADLIPKTPFLAQLYYLAHYLRPRQKRQKNRVFSMTCGSLLVRDTRGVWKYCWGGVRDKRCETLNDFLNMVPKDCDDPLHWDWHVWITEQRSNEDESSVETLVHAFIPLNALVLNQCDAIASDDKRIACCERKDVGFSQVGEKDYVMELRGVNEEALRNMGLVHVPAAPEVQSDLFRLVYHVYKGRAGSPSMERTLLEVSRT